MRKFELYDGFWPRNVSKTAKYAVSHDDGNWKISVRCDLGDGLRYFAIAKGGGGIADVVNEIKLSVAGKEGGPFYINEFGHLIVPTKEGDTSEYYYGGSVVPDFEFDFDGELLTSRPIKPDGTPLAPGSDWVGPRPGIPYILEAGADDIRYERVVFTDESPKKVKRGLTRRFKLSKFMPRETVRDVINPILKVKGHKGGRFYVNEHRAIFTPRTNDANELDCIYCGQLDLKKWFPEPKQENIS